MTASEANAPAQIAVLPLGATEQHGPHLPFETDTLIADAIARRLKNRIAGELDVMFLPVEPVGYSVEHMDVTGTRTLGFDEAIDRWIGIGAKLSALGTRKLVMLNAHGGNSPLMTIVATELRVRHTMLAVATSWTRFGYPADIVTSSEKAIGIHGGLIETSVMLAIRPDLVEMTKAQDFASAQSGFERDFTHLRAYGPHAFGWKMSDLTPHGVTGNAAQATAEKGERILNQSVDGLADLLRDVAKFDLATFR